MNNFVVVVAVVVKAVVVVVEGCSRGESEVGYCPVVGDQGCDQLRCGSIPDPGQTKLIN